MREPNVQWRRTEREEDTRDINAYLQINCVWEKIIDKNPDVVMDCSSIMAIVCLCEQSMSVLRTVASYWVLIFKFPEIDKHFLAF